MPLKYFTPTLDKEPVEILKLGGGTFLELLKYPVEGGNTGKAGL